MDVDFNTIVALLTVVGSLAVAIFTEEKYRKAKANLVELIGDVADVLALVYAASKAGKCDAKTLEAIAKKTEEVWTDIGLLGPTFASLLEEKSALANALKLAGPGK